MLTNYTTPPNYFEWILLSFPTRANLRYSRPFSFVKVEIYYPPQTRNSIAHPLKSGKFIGIILVHLQLLMHFLAPFKM